MQVDRGAPGDVAGEREAGLDGEACDDEARHDDEAYDSDGPSEADERDEALEEDGKYHAPDGAPTQDDADRCRSAPAEPVAHDGHGWIEPRLIKIL